MTRRHNIPKKKRRNTYNRTRRNSSSQKNSPLTWLLGGIIIGIIIPSFFLFRSHSTHTQEFTHEKLELASEAQLAPPKTSKPKHSKPTHDEASSHHYHFYDLLAKQDDTEEDESLEPPGTTSFHLEIAAFKSFNQADQLKAQLVLLGLDDISIKRSTTHNHLSFKVTAGPFTSKDAAVKAQQLLLENKITSQLAED